MKIFVGILSILGLCLTVIPAFLVFSGAMEWRTHTQLMFAGMVLWFLFAPFWMGKHKDSLS